MTKDTLLTAQIGTFTCQLTVTISGNGSVDIHPNQTVFDSSTTVTLTPLPAAGHAFTQWEGGVSELDIRKSPLSFLMTSDRAITAIFEPAITYVVTCKNATVALLEDQTIEIDPIDAAATVKIKPLKPGKTPPPNTPTSLVVTHAMIPCLSLLGPLRKLYTEAPIGTIEPNAELDSFTAKAGQAGVSGVFIAGADSLGQPVYSGSIRSIAVKKGVGLIQGEAHLSPAAKPIKFKPEQGGLFQILTAPPATNVSARSSSRSATARQP